MLSSDMTDTNSEDLAVWRGPFSWDGLLLRLHIRTVKHDYDAEDPRTWPLIKDVVQTEVNYDYRQTKPAPRFLAYDQSLMENLVTQRPLASKASCRPNLAGYQIKALFADYPFNFDRYGAMRNFPHLPAAELEEWMRLMRGTIPDAKHFPDISPRPIKASNNSSSVQKNRSVPSGKAFEPAMKTSSEENPSTSATAQDNFKTAQHRPEGTVETAVDALITAHTKSLHTATQKTRALELLVNDHHHEAEEQAQAAKAKIKILGEQLERQREELEAAKKETAETNEAIVWVWNEVQKLSKVIVRKREDNDGDSASEKKKIKVEG